MYIDMCIHMTYSDLVWASKSFVMSLKEIDSSVTLKTLDYH